MNKLFFQIGKMIIILLGVTAGVDFLAHFIKGYGRIGYRDTRYVLPNKATFWNRVNLLVVCIGSFILALVFILYWNVGPNS